MKKIVILLIRIYQRTFSAYTPRRCRFYPTCSEYSLQAIQKYGIVRGMIKGIWRILRCNPFNYGGYDPLD